MTPSPQEKAIEIVEMFSAKAEELQENTSFSYDKECALICVDEIMLLNFDLIQTISDFNYWEQVKAEIEKL